MWTVRGLVVLGTWRCPYQNRPCSVPRRGEVIEVVRGENVQRGRDRLQDRKASPNQTKGLVAKGEKPRQSEQEGCVLDNRSHRTSRGHVFGGAPLWTVDQDGRIAVGLSTSPHVLIHDAHGIVLDTVTIDRAPKHVTSRERESVFRMQEGSYSNAGLPPSQVADLISFASYRRNPRNSKGSSA